MRRLKLVLRLMMLALTPDGIKALEKVLSEGYDVFEEVKELMREVELGIGVSNRRLQGVRAELLELIVAIRVLGGQRR